MTQNLLKAQKQISSKRSMETLNLASCCLKDVQLSDRFFKFLVSSLSRAIFLMEQFGFPVAMEEIVRTGSKYGRYDGFEVLV